MLPKVSIGIPFYGGVPAEWWTQMMQFSAAISKTVELRDIITCGTMTADHSRNLIAGDFLKSDSEWLFWIDSDTQVPVGALERMIAHGKTLVSGLYYGKNDPHPPIAYYKFNGAYQPIDKATKWEKGEIIPVDSAGMGCMLTHRSVFEDIRDSFRVFQIPGGGIVTTHKDDVYLDDKVADTDVYDGKIVNGQLRIRLTEPTLVNLRFPFFMIDHLRTEDIHFFELAERVGHRLYLDTSVECGHLRNVAFTGKDYRDINGH